MIDHSPNRDRIIAALRTELVGPDPRGTEVDLARVAQLSYEDYWAPHRQLGTGEEIISRDSPTRRYGVGVLYPLGMQAQDLETALVATVLEGDQAAGDGTVASDGNGDSEGGENAPTRRAAELGEAESDDLDLTAANAYKQSSMGLSFLAELPEGTVLTVRATGGRYKPHPVPPAPPRAAGGAAAGGGDVAEVDGPGAAAGAAADVDGQLSRASDSVVQALGPASSPEEAEPATGVDGAGGDGRNEPPGSGEAAMEEADPGAASLQGEAAEGASKREGVWWLREPVTVAASFRAEDLLESRAVKRSDPGVQENSDGLSLSVEVFSRPQGKEQPRHRLLTVCLVNRAEAGAGSGVDRQCLFQTHFTVTVEDGSGAAYVLPYPKPPALTLDAEEQSLALLYRSVETFAVGHGCAASWTVAPGGLRSQAVSAECLPQFETPSITPDVTREDREQTPVEVPMAPLAGLVQGDDGFALLDGVVALYEGWIERKRGEAGALPEEHQSAASDHIGRCKDAAARMRAGIRYLRSDAKALEAFRLANHAVLLQQIHARRVARTVTYNQTSKRIEFSEAAAKPDPLRPEGNRGKWRAFQIAFLLMAVESTASGESPDRETVELIWFPTGGGKTEAYLGLAAFSMFLRRLRDPGDRGVQVLMRYTLRLLTAQQFQRAAALLCAMEHLRGQNRRLGDERFSIGIWVGGDTTPNTHKQALSNLRVLTSGASYAENPFLITRCPWCGAQMGKIEYAGRPPKTAPRVVGYEQDGHTVVLQCSDRACEFSDGLPIHVIDEDIYEQRPSMVIGTVDKFAMLAWRPQARALFGIGSDGSREMSPPGLIIQDELHLISGPLGSMVGLYEGAIEELCTDRRGGRVTKPKIVSSTATIRRFEAQIRALYARETVALFPPPGLEAGDSFFARYARNPDGSLQHGRMYVGVHAPGLGSMQTVEVRTFSALLQAPMDLPDNEERDPWWTLLAFFNSLRELGTTLSLFQSDIPDYLRAVQRRTGREPKAMRYAREPKELTSRLNNEDVPKAIDELEVPYGTAERRAVDVCLASNIIEVGVDIDRLSLMAVVGQPKTTAQYIQVTGRVGRRWWERPGLVVTLYGASKPRDRSHFEKFRSYHERLYAQVEPTSVTPFSPPALDRALHAVVAAYVRQKGGKRQAANPDPYPDALVKELHELLSARVLTVDSEEASTVQQVFGRRTREWQSWDRTRWDRYGEGEDTPLLRVAGDYADQETAAVSWATPMSMRNVDAECQATVTRRYLNADTTTGDGQLPEAQNGTDGAGDE